MTVRSKKHVSPGTNAPIGIFDSGIGGLTVAEAICNLMPGESIIYFGDTAHLPYGDKAPDSIRSYAVRIADFLLDQGCKIIVIACNTASSIAFETVQKHVGKRAAVIDVINPVVQAVSRRSSLKHIGVIGTRATIRSDAYAKRIKALRPDKEVSSLATPLLAPMIEEGFFNNNISRTVIYSYLERPKIRKIDSLILACTHYPLIRPEIESFYKGRISIIDSAQIVAEHVQGVLRSRKLLSTQRKGTYRFYISDYTASFARSTRIFFSGKVKLEKNNLWEP